jgi:hypothetical protein
MDYETTNDSNNFIYKVNSEIKCTNYQYPNVYFIIYY